MRLPLVSSNDVLKLLSKRGFFITRQKGSHICLHKKGEGRTLLVVVPRKNQIKRGTLISILRQAKITREEFLSEIE